MALLQGLACDFFQTDSNSAGRNSPKGTSSVRCPELVRFA